MNTAIQKGSWYELFSRYAEDLYPGRYTAAFCRELEEKAHLITSLAKEKHSHTVAHNYLYPEFHEIAALTGDSLALSVFAKRKQAIRVDFGGVFFMGATAKIIAGDRTQVFVQDNPEAIGCSLVSGTSYEWIELWKKKYPDGILVSYINSDAYIKSISDYIGTSRNTDKVIAHAVKNNPGKKILVLPDKFLGFVMKSRALTLLEQEDVRIDSDLIEVYQYSHNGFHASCYVHELIGNEAIDQALLEHPEAELMIHPECGCASSCLYKLNAGLIPHTKAYFLSTDQMIDVARSSPAQKFIVATEKGMIYKLRKEVPNKTFVPVSDKAECRFMKANTLDKLMRSLTEDRIEIMLCNDCCDPKKPYQDERVVHIQRSVAEKATQAIDKMLTIY